MSLKNILLFKNFNINLILSHTDFSIQDLIILRFISFLCFEVCFFSCSPLCFLFCSRFLSGRRLLITSFSQFLRIYFIFQNRHPFTPPIRYKKQNRLLSSYINSKIPPSLQLNNSTFRVLHNIMTPKSPSLKFRLIIE